MGGVVRAEKPSRKERTVADVRRETQRRVQWEEREVDAAHVRGWRDWRSGGDEDIDPAGAHYKRPARVKTKASSSRTRT
jgi:hypothetical protein